MHAIPFRGSVQRGRLTSHAAATAAGPTSGTCPDTHPCLSPTCMAPCPCPCCPSAVPHPTWNRNCTIMVKSLAVGLASVFGDTAAG